MMHCACVLGGAALSMVLVDLGNGVTRISEVAMVPLGGDVGEEWCDLDFPLPVRVRDAFVVALGLLGAWPCGCVFAGRARGVSDVAAEVRVRAIR